MTALLIGQVAERTGLAVSAIRYYEEMGLVRPGRSTTGQRVFARGDIRRLSFVMIAQRLGFTLKETEAALASLPNERTPTKADWTRLSKRFRVQLDKRIEGLAALRDRLDGCIGCGCLSLSVCALHNPDDKAREEGTGPRFLTSKRPPPA